MQGGTKKKMRTKSFLTTTLLGLVLFTSAAFASGISQPDLPSECSELEVAGFHGMIFHTYAIGVQIYRWNGSSWELVAPDATLYAESGYHGKVAKHYAGPTWESNSGSKVIGRKLKECSPDSSAIPWLLLESVSSDGPGIFGKVSYVQRLNTAGGLKPSGPGAEVGETRRIPYSAEYFFYGQEIE
jgi:hypothetical protein